MKVVILAGGFGTRISEESQFKPKPMVELGGMPILLHIMKIYSAHGYNEFIICAGYILSALLRPRSHRSLNVGLLFSVGAPDLGCGVASLGHHP